MVQVLKGVEGDSVDGTNGKRDLGQKEKTLPFEKIIVYDGLQY